MFRRITLLSGVLTAMIFGGAAAGVLRADEPAKGVVIPGGKACQGTLVIRGNSYKLDQAVAYSSIVLDENSINVLVSNAAIPVDELKAALNDGNDDKFTFFKPNVKITFSKEGKARFFNAYADGGSVSASGSDLKGQLVVKDGRVNGSCTYAPDDKKNGFDVQFDLALIPLPQAYFTKVEAEKAARLERKQKDEQDRIAKKKEDAAKSAVAEVNGPKARSLPLPKDATDVVYEKLTGQIRCRCSSDVETTANFLAQQYNSQGWTAASKDLIRAKSGILKRTKGDATLSIFVRPAEGATSVQIISKNLSWGETAPDKSKP